LWRGISLVFAIFFIAGCVANTPARGQFGINNGEIPAFWAGRLALVVQSSEDQQNQSFFASFELQGNALEGSLSLFSPVSTVAVMSWKPGEALLHQSGQAQARRFESASSMIEQVTGAPLQLPALFDWLQGRERSLAGWQVDLSQQPQGRIVAKRISPLPALDLRIVLEKE
jgi:outer membrane lipoprotein LolB